VGLNYFPDDDFMREWIMTAQYKMGEFKPQVRVRVRVGRVRIR